MDTFSDDQIRWLAPHDRGMIVPVGDGDTGNAPTRPPYVDAAGQPQPGGRHTSVLDSVPAETSAHAAWRMWHEQHRDAPAGNAPTRDANVTDVPAWSQGYDAGYRDGWQARDESPFTGAPSGLE